MNNKFLLNFTTGMSMLGAILVSFGKPFEANIIWSISNPILMYHNYEIKQYAQSRLFLVFEIITLFGVYNLW